MTLTWSTPTARTRGCCGAPSRTGCGPTWASITPRTRRWPRTPRSRRGAPRGGAPKAARGEGAAREGIAGKLSTVGYLIQALTMVIFTGSAQHAAVNFAQAGVMTFVPLAPGAAYRAAPPSRADAALNPGLDQYPPLDMATLQLEFLSLLGGVHHTKLGDYPFMWFKNLHVHGHLKAFQEDLERIGATIQERNTQRLFPYPYFIPSAIPQSINI